MQPIPPAPYGHSSYPRPQSPVYFAQRIEVSDGAKLATFVYGPSQTSLAALLRGDLVLALHGNGGSHATFVNVIDTLTAAGVGVIALDGRAQGQSTRGSLPLSYELFTSDAVAVLDVLGVKSVHIVGHSDGGIISLLMARDYPERVRSIVAGGANLTPEGVIDEWDTAGSVQQNRQWAAWMEEAQGSSEVDPSLLPSAQSVLCSAELLQLMLDEPHIDAASLAAIRCPTCVLVGEHDCITLEETNAIAKAIPGARLVTVPGVGHSLPRLAPDSVVCQVLTNILLCR